MVTAALAGLAAGINAVAQDSNSNPNQAKPKTTGPSTKKTPAKDAGKKTGKPAQDKHACMGQNSCKGKGGCSSGDNGCKGKNSCKGKGGCATDGSLPMS
jgi:hypothetical protein